MVSTLKNMIWGPARQGGGTGGPNGESDEEEKKGQTQTNAGLVTSENTVKEGWLYKQSRYMKQWKRQVDFFCKFTNHKRVLSARRYVVLTRNHLCTFKDNTNFNQPTEVIQMESCCTVKSSDEEINKQYSFVSESLKMSDQTNIIMFVIEIGSAGRNYILHVCR